MIDPEELLNEKAIRMVVDILTDEKFNEQTRLNVLRGFKLTLNKGVSTLETKLINAYDIESLLDAVSLANREGHAGDDDFQTEYFKFLLNLARDRPELHDKVRLEILQLAKNKITCESLVMNLWTVLEAKSLVWPELLPEVLPYSKQFLEEKIFDWLKTFTKSNMRFEELNVKYYAQLSVQCSDLFRIISAILNKFVILTEGNEKVLEFVGNFSSLVSQICDEQEKPIFKLYPRNYCDITSLLLIPPTIFEKESPKNSSDASYKTNVLKLLLDAFQNDSNTLLLLLTHYPKWLTEFAVFKSAIDDNV